MDDTIYMPLDQHTLSNEASKRRSLLITSTTLALLLMLTVFWHPSQMPHLQQVFCPSTILPASAPSAPSSSSETAAVLSDSAAVLHHEQSHGDESSKNDTIATTTRTFHATKIYSDLSPAADEAWERLIPANGGFVVISREHENGDQAASTTQTQTGAGTKSSREMAGVSMFHQLHCLSMIRMAVQDMRAGRTPVLDEIQDDDDSMHHHHGQTHDKVKRKTTKEEHWVHCLDYLVQAVLCAADDTIEPAYTTKDGGLVVDGYGIQHRQCRDPDRVWRLAGGGSMSRPGWEERQL